MLGVILFTIILFFYSIVLLELWDKINISSEKVNNILSSFKAFFEKGSIRFIIAMAGIVIGVWNFFAPDFGYIYGGPTILGALLPSLAMVLSSVVIYPGVVEILNISEEEKKKYYDFINKYRGVAGIITLVISILHAVLHKVVLF